MEKILSAHEAATVERIKSHPVVLLVNDTTQLNYVVERKKEGLGTIRTQERTRYHFHPTIALTPDRLCLGTVKAKFWQRPEETEGHLRKQKEIIRWYTCCWEIEIYFKVLKGGCDCRGKNTAKQSADIENVC